MNNMKKFNVLLIKMTTRCHNKDEENEFFFPLV